jgi:hypothetical protein
MATYESFTHTPAEYAATLTNQTHMTLDWLANREYITREQWDTLTGTLVVTPIQNNKNWGTKILDRFFKKDAESNTYVFPIVQLDEYIPPSKAKPTKAKPTLELV